MAAIINQTATIVNLSQDGEPDLAPIDVLVLAEIERGAYDI